MMPSATRFGFNLFVLSLLALPTIAHPQTTGANHHKRIARIAAHSGWRELACVADTSPLPADAYHFVDGTLTHETCISTCAGLGFPVAGTRNGDECWCAATPPDATNSWLDHAECDRPCAGSAHQSCGGISESLIFVNGASEQFLDASAPRALKARTPSTLPTGWSVAGACVVDSSSRVLVAASASPPANSPTVCITLCAQLGYKLAGLEDGNQCFCDNSYAAYPTPAPTSDCNSACQGDSVSTDTCGGPWRLQIYSNGPVSLPPSTPTTLPSGWASAVACAVDSNTRVLADYSTQPSTNSPAVCATLCDGLGYKLAGVEDGNECHCGNSYAAYPTAAPTTDCKSACQGDSVSTDTCGGGWRLQIYSKGAVPLTPTTLPAGWAAAVACAVDSDTRVLADYSTQPSPNSPAVCTTLCDGLGYKLAGVEDGNECHCGNSYAAYPTAAPATDCQTACQGDNVGADTCGGGWRLQIYSKGSVPLPAATMPAGWAAAITCAVDSNTRVLADYETWPSPNSPAICASICDGLGYKLAGVESGAECHCGNSYAAYPTTAPATDCNAACPGDAVSTDTCGGGWRLQIYSKGSVPLPAATLPTGWASAITCAVDSNTRVLADYSTQPSPNSPAVCATLCDGLGYKLAGVEDGNECHCGNSYAAYPNAAPATDCNSACQGDAVTTDTCGGGWRLQVYSKGAVPLPAAPLPAGWISAVGCAVDSSSRVLAAYTTTPATNSPATCATVCDGLGYKLAGVENGNECYCANSYSTTPTAAPAADCDSPCNGDSASETCGGGWRLQIYSKGSVTVPQLQAKSVIVQMFEWTWDSIAIECTQFLGPAGYGYIQVSPAQETIQGPQWWTDYQPVSYTLVGKRGNRAQYQTMIATCHAAGVKVIADTIMNHMAGISGGTGTAGTVFTQFNYPGTYTSQNFHYCGLEPNNVIVNYMNRLEVQTCELDGLADLATDTEPVRARLAQYLNDLISLGVDGMRLDAAKHMPTTDIANILSRTTSQVYITQEVQWGAGEPITPAEYVQNGDVQEFRYTSAVQSAFSSGGNLASLQNLDSQGWVPSASANVFVANHDTERNGNSLNYNSPSNQYTNAMIFSLAHSYGQPSILSSYTFPDTDAGAPTNGAGACYGAGGVQGWLCQHRWTGVAGMVGFRNTVGSAAITNWVSPGGTRIAFGRGSSGFVAINNDDASWQATFTTSLPSGTYCDVVSGTLSLGSCTGSSFTVSSSGTFSATVPARGAIAIHINARR